jgi:hypothetical protein
VNNLLMISLIRFGPSSSQICRLTWGSSSNPVQRKFKWIRMCCISKFCR